MSFVLRRTEEINVEDLTGQLADAVRAIADRLGTHSESLGGSIERFLKTS